MKRNGKIPLFLFSIEQVRSRNNFFLVFLNRPFFVEKENHIKTLL